jgi:small subunit ribosomal protein S1
MEKQRYTAITEKLTSNDTFSTGENFADMFTKSTQQGQKKEGSVVVGEIVAIENDSVIVDVGLKNEGRIPLKEFIIKGQLPELKVGDQIRVMLEKIESRNGKTLLSREKAIREEVWNEIETSLSQATIVDGVIVSKIKGGYIVDIGGIVAFLPGSQVDVKPVRDITPLMGIIQPFQILKIDRTQGNIVVSRRAILEESRAEARNELLSQIQEGQVLEGVVKNITNYGAFVDLGSVDGLLHVTDISWSRISHPSEVLTLGQTIQVKVIKYNTETKRISLGMKQLQHNPWQDIEQKYPVGSRIKGTVTNIADYGAFIELEKGIEGLVHVSEISWLKNNVNPRKYLNIGQEIEVVVLEVDSDKHRISLGVKQCSDNPWEIFASKHPVGSVIEGAIKNVVEFGLFIGLENNIDGLIHASDLSWDGSPEEEIKKFKKDDVVKAVVLAIDVEKERISLGIKQLSEDESDKIFKELKKGSVVTSVVTDVKEDGIEVSVNDSLVAFIKKADLSSERVEQRPERFAVGDKVDAKITLLDKNSRKISLSIKALEIDEQKRAIAEYGSTNSGASLGDILGAALNKSNIQ